MPVRTMNFDAMNYAAQVTEAGKKHRKQKDYATPAEFLYGFGKEDTLTPVITRTVYWGAEKWDAPRSLHDMFSEKEAKTDMCKAWEEQLERGKEIGKELGMELSAGVYKQIMSGERDNVIIAQNCGCTQQEVEEIRRVFAI